MESMNSTVARERPVVGRVETSQQSKSGMTLLMVVLGGYWALLCNQLRVDWTVNPQYYYGWVVPLLALGLFHFRWVSRPAADPPARSPGFVIIAVALPALLLPIRLAEEANPEWRLVMWVHAIQMVVLTLGILYYAGGWSWVRHCAFPVCFFLVAVPWPVPFEQLVIQGLMRGIASVTVETAGLLNIPAAQNGNVIEISTGLVGIDEACSGVRSIQTTLFVSLFLGELYRLSAVRRAGLTAGSLLLALIGNLGRTTFLVWCAAHQGLNRMHELHDTAGAVALVATIVGLWLLGQWFRTGNRNPPPVKPGPQQFGRRLPLSTLCWLAVWAVTVEGATELWYRSHETRVAENARWSINWPVGENKFSETPVDDKARSMLRYSTGRSAAWQDGAGNHWQMFLFRWEPGRNSAQLATAHTPDICLQAAGYQLADDLGTHAVKARGLSLPVRQSVFTWQGQPLHVFYCLWEDHPAQAMDETGDSGPLNLEGRLRAVLKGRRHLGQQVLETAIQGPATAEEAREVFDSQIGQLISRN